MSWIKFRDNYLFSINFAIMLSVILYAVRKDFNWHPAVGLWLVLALISPRIRENQKRLLMVVGRVNSMILLSVFYFAFFTPFSILYRLFFRNRAFLPKVESRLVIKNSVSDFERPF